MKELNVAPRDMGFVAEPIREEPVWTMSPTELYLDCIFDRRLPEEVTPYRDALMRFICGQTEAEKITIDSRIDDSQYTQTDIRLYREKTSVYPGRHMGCIRVAEGDNVWNKMVAEELMSQVEIREI